MARLPPLLPTPPASLKLRDTDAVESRAPKRHRPLEPPPRPEDLGSRRHREPSPPPSCRRRSRSPPPSKVRRRSRSPPPSNVWRRSRSPPPSNVRRRRSPPSKVRRRSRSPPPSNVRRRSRSPPSKVRRRSRSPPPSKVRRRSRSPRYVSSTQRLAEWQHAKRPSAEAAVEGERSRPSLLDDSLLENRPSHSNRNCEHQETSSAAVEKRPGPAIPGDEQELHSEKMDGKNQSDHKIQSRSARRKKMKRQIVAEAKKQMREHPETSSPAAEKRPDSAIRGYEHQLHSKMDGNNQSGNKDPSRNASRKKTRREIWAEAKKEFREMKKDKLLENIKKLQACVLLLEKDGADMAEIMEFRSMLESTKKQYVENEAQLAKEGQSAPLQLLKRDRLEKTAVPERNKLAEEVKRLKSELETVRQDLDDQLAQAQSLMADVSKQKEVARRYGVELEDAMMRIAALEKGCLLRRETIEAPQVQLASANERLTVPSPTRDLMPS